MNETKNIQTAELKTLIYAEGTLVAESTDPQLWLSVLKSIADRDKARKVVKGGMADP